MNITIKDGFVHLAKEREKLTKVLNDKGDIGTKRLANWVLFNTTCVIAETYQSDVRKKLKLNIATGYLDKAKIEMKKFGINHDDFLSLEKALLSIINSIDAISQMSIDQYKAKISDVKNKVIESEGTPTLKK